MTAADDLRYRRQTGSRCDLVISNELLPADLQQLSLTLHVEGFQSCRQLGFDVTRNSANIRSADPENPALEPNMKCIGSPVAEIWPFAYLGPYGTPFWGKGRS